MAQVLEVLTALAASYAITLLFWRVFCYIPGGDRPCPKPPKRSKDR